MASVFFFAEGLDFELPHPRKTKSWIKLVVRKEKRVLSSLNFVFCSDAFLTTLNANYLHHLTLTDVITFDYSQNPKEIDGEVYISVERIRENASQYKNTFDEELHRVIIHGVLHLVGYNDKKKAEIAQIRKKEEAYLSLRP